MAERLFTAIWSDDATRRALAVDLDRIRPDASDVHWQPVHRWHITTAFLGAAEPATTIARIEAILNRGGPAGAEPIRLSGSGAFGPVVWLGVEHGPWLDELAAALNRGLHTDENRFKAHVTVGRIRGPGATRRAREVAALLSEHVGPWWTPDELTLVESHTGPRPSYDVLATWPLHPTKRADSQATPQPWAPPDLSDSEEDQPRRSHES